MVAISGAIWAIAYILGLFLAELPGRVVGLPIGSVLLLLSGTIAASFVPRYWRFAPRSRIWLIAGLIGFAATFYYQFRLPTPSATDICHLAPMTVSSKTQASETYCPSISPSTTNQSLTPFPLKDWVGERLGTSPSSHREGSNQAADRSDNFQVIGTIDSSPRLTRSGKIQFDLRVTQVNHLSNQDRSETESSKESSKESLKEKINEKIGEKTSEKSNQEKLNQAETGLTRQHVTGKLYVTISPLQERELYPGRSILVEGTLYRPDRPNSPSEFNFQKYLARQGMFAGLRGRSLRFLEVETQAPSLIWQIRQRIITVHALGLGNAEGALVSAMVMGAASVDVPYDIRDRFIQIGLAHALAASGFQVSLIVEIVLKLTERCQQRVRCIIGILAVVGYIGLTGIEPSVARAGLMGLAVLLSHAFDRRLKPIPTLLFVAVILLVCRPSWIFDLGFQLSFLATLGLIVTVPFLIKWLDWLPVTIAALIAVPTAAYLWTLPLQLFVFGTVSLYCILINVLTSIPITIISLGGMLSALVALVYPLAGSWLAGWLHYPTWGLIKLAESTAQLPGSAFAIGTIALWQLLSLYGLFVCFGWSLIQQWQRWLLASLALGLLIVPIVYTSTHLQRITVLNSTEQPVFVVQDRGTIGLINSGDQDTARFTVLPFLRQQGINQIDWAIDAALQESHLAGWQHILTTVPIRLFYHHPVANDALTASDRSSQDITSDQITSDQITSDHQTFEASYRSLVQVLQRQRGSALRLTAGQTLQPGTLQVALLSVTPPILQLTMADRVWLLLDFLRYRDQEQWVSRDRRWAGAVSPEVLWWTKGKLTTEFLDRVRPKLALSRFIPPEMQPWFAHHRVMTYQTSQDGALQWTPQWGLQGLQGLRSTVQ